MEALLLESEILSAADERFVSLAVEGAERILEGKTDSKQRAKAQNILQLVKAYDNKVELSDDERESILYALWDLCDVGLGPTVKNVSKILQTVIAVTPSGLQSDEAPSGTFLQSDDAPDGTVLHSDDDPNF